MFYRAELTRQQAPHRHLVQRELHSMSVYASYVEAAVLNQLNHPSLVETNGLRETVYIFCSVH